MSKKKKIKKNFISTPKKWYLLGLSLLVILLIIWVLNSIISEDNITNSIEDIAKNAFFAIFGSLIVSLLIDIGNTARDNEIKKGAFIQLRNNLDTIYQNIFGISFILNNALSIDNEGIITLSHYYNKEFYFTYSNIVSFVTFNDIDNFKEKIDIFISKVINSHSFTQLDSELRDAIETLAIERFYSIINLDERVIKDHFIFHSFKEDIKKLKDITATLGKYLDMEYEISFLSENEAVNHHNERIKYAKEHQQEIENLYSYIRK